MTQSKDEGLPDDGAPSLPTADDILNEPNRDLRRDIVRSIRGVFERPPDLERCESVLAENDLEAAIETLAALFRLHGFRSERTHLELLQRLDIRSLSTESKLTLHQLQYLLLDVQGEHSLGLEQIEHALQLALRECQPETILDIRISIGATYGKLRDPRIDAWNEASIEYAKAHGLEENLAWVYHNWATTRWSRGEFAAARLLWERAKPLRRKEGPTALAKHLGFVAQRLESIDLRAATSTYQELAAHAEAHDCLSAEHKAEVQFRIASLLLEMGNIAAAAIHAESAFMHYRKADDHEARVAWSAALLAYCYEILGDMTRAAHYQSVRSKILEKFGSETDRFKDALRRCLAEPASEASRKELAQLEGLAIVSRNRLLYLDWVLVYGMSLERLGEHGRLLDLCQHAIGTLGPPPFAELESEARTGLVSRYESAVRFLPFSIECRNGSTSFANPAS